MLDHTRINNINKITHNNFGNNFKIKMKLT